MLASPEPTPRTPPRAASVVFARDGGLPVYLAGIHAHYDEVPHQDRLEKRTRGFDRLGRAISSRLVRAALDARREHSDRVNEIFDEIDVLVTPVTGQLPVPVGKWRGRGAFRTVLGMSRTYPFTALWNYTGQPAAAVPVGIGADGLPRSVMLIAPPDREDLLLSLAGQMEEAIGWPDHRPPTT